MEKINIPKVQEIEKSSQSNPTSPRTPKTSSMPSSPPEEAAGALTKHMNQKVNCLCSPTTHAGSFRCRYHRNGVKRSSLSYGSGLAELAKKGNNEPAGTLRA